MMHLEPGDIELRFIPKRISVQDSNQRGLAELRFTFRERADIVMLVSADDLTIVAQVIEREAGLLAFALGGRHASALLRAVDMVLEESEENGPLSSWASDGTRPLLVEMHDELVRAMMGLPVVDELKADERAQDARNDDARIAAERRGELCSYVRDYGGTLITSGDCECPSCVFTRSQR